MCLSIVYVYAVSCQTCHHTMTTRYVNATATPSWSEFWNFVKFLSFQLQDCERSCYTNPDITRDGSLPGFKEFIVKFMILMSKVISVHSTDTLQQHFFYIAMTQFSLGVHTSFFEKTL